MKSRSVIMGLILLCLLWNLQTSASVGRPLGKGAHSAGGVLVNDDEYISVSTYGGAFNAKQNIVRYNSSGDLLSSGNLNIVDDSCVDATRLVAIHQSLFVMSCGMYWPKYVTLVHGFNSAGTILFSDQIQDPYGGELIIPTRSGGFALVERQERVGGLIKVTLVIKTKDGTTLSSHDANISSFGGDYVTSFAELPNNNFFLAGKLAVGGFLAEVSSDGKVQKYITTNWLVREVIVSSDNQIIGIGEERGGHGELFVKKFDLSFNKIWEQPLQGKLVGTISNTRDGNVVILAGDYDGMSDFDHYNDNVHFVKLNVLG